MVSHRRRLNCMHERDEQGDEGYSRDHIALRRQCKIDYFMFCEQTGARLMMSRINQDQNYSGWEWGTPAIPR